MEYSPITDKRLAEIKSNIAIGVYGVSKDDVLGLIARLDAISAEVVESHEERHSLEEWVRAGEKL